VDSRAASAAAVALLARRDFSSSELADKLQAQGYEADTIQGVVAELAERKFIDDERYVRQFVSYHAGRGQGPARIRHDLAALGLGAAMIDVALAQGPDWRALAREVRVRKFGLEIPASWADKARQARFLQYRGFCADHIRTALGPDFDA